MARFHSDYRAGTTSYARDRQTWLRRRAALAEGRAARAKSPEARRLAQRQAATARRGIRQIEARREFREELNDRDRNVFNALSIEDQRRFIATVRQYPEYVSQRDDDPFGSRPSRSSLWRLYYSTRAGIRRREVA